MGQGLVLGEGPEPHSPQLHSEGQGLVLGEGPQPHSPGPEPVVKEVKDVRSFLTKQYEDIKEARSHDSAIDSYNEGNRLYNLGEYDNATQFYDNATELNPQFVEAWNNKANALLFQNRLEDALQAYNKVLAYDNKSAHAWGTRGWILNHIQPPQYEDALSSLEKAIELEPNTDNTSWYLNEKGNALSGLNRLPEALEANNESIRRDPNLWFTWNDRAIVLYKMSNYCEALKSISKSIEELRDMNKTIDSIPPDKDALDAQNLTRDIQNTLKRLNQRCTSSS
jgi:tetratricopeptide (TPR) repeat protein